jgi:hypothetical protein
MLRRSLLAVVAAGFVALPAGAALAGGSWLEPSWVRVEPGDEMTLTATVSRGQLGWVDDRPFYAYLQGDEYGVVTASGFGGTATDVMLGLLEITTGSPNLAVSVDVVVPANTPRGEYQVTVCNDPCTTGLGDLIGAVLFVGIDPPPPEDSTFAGTTTVAAIAVVETSTTVAPDPPRTYVALAPINDRSTTISPLWVGFSAALGGAVLLTALITRNRA